MRGTAKWGFAGLSSVAIHAAALALLAAMLRPGEVAQQQAPPTEITLAAETVRRAQATEQETDAPRAAGQPANATPLVQGAPRRTRADASRAESPRLDAAPLPAATPSPVGTRPVALAEAETGAERVPQASMQAGRAETLAATGQSSGPEEIDRDRAEPVSPAIPAMAVAEAASKEIGVADPLAGRVAAASPAGNSLQEVGGLTKKLERSDPQAATGTALPAAGPDLAEATPSPAPAPQQRLQASRTDLQSPQIQAALARPPRTKASPGITAIPKALATAAPAMAAANAISEPTAGQQTQPLQMAALPAQSRPATGKPALPEQPRPETSQRLAPAAAQADETPAESAAPRLTAALAWQIGDPTIADPVSMEAIQAFMAPQSLAEGAAETVRDGLEALLADIPCARVRTEFVPETATLELRGHVPEDGLRLPLLAALQARMGSSIRVADELSILPAPQCGALTGIAALGLPQSEEQNINPMVLGENAHVREYAFREGDYLELDFYAPEYESFVYIDFFDATGNVFHLQPNETVPPRLEPPDSFVTSGVERSDRPFLRSRIAPPFAREIVVAFAASMPLYDGLRPIAEPAGPYLDFLRDRITAAREEHPDFKGEWVYFIVATGP